MDFLGVILILVGGFLVDFGVTNRNPATVLRSVLADPASARASISAQRGTGYQTTPPVGSSTAGGTGTLSATPTGSTGTTPAIAYARAQIGKPYRWGATGPAAFDCSGLIVAAYKSVGYNLPRTTYQMIADPRLSPVAHSALVPGDLVFPDAGHVGIYTGNGQYIEAPRTGLTVREVPVWGFLTARRVPGTTGVLVA